MPGRWASAQTVVLRWTGTAWQRIRSPNPSGFANDNDLFGVTVISASNVLAVGHFSNGTANRMLMLHWNGSRWNQVATPDPDPGDRDSMLIAVAGHTASDVWAVGTAEASDGRHQALAFHCC
jgi:hypothetical protein